MTFRVFWDDEFTLTAELDLIYYNGHSGNFTIIDEENNYYKTEITGNEVDGSLRRYKLHVEELEIGKNYVAADERFLKTSVQYRYIVRTDHFDELFYYCGDDLGSSYTKKQTTFKVWSPRE